MFTERIKALGTRTLIPRVGVALAVAAAALVSTSGSASAATPQMHSTGGIRDCTNLGFAGCNPWGSLPQGTPLTMVCYQDESSAVGEYDSNRWFYIVTAGDQKGYVHSSRVFPQTTVPKCTTHRGVMATNWASQHVGIKTTTAAERTAIPTTINYWSGYCATFTYAAHKLGAGVTPRYAGDARPRFYAYEAARVMRYGTPVNVGSLVFWPNLTQWGHVAVYVGNGMVVSTRGVPGGATEVQRVPISTFGTPSGWVEYWNV